MAMFCYYFAWEWINISLEYTAAAWLNLPRFFLACVAVNLMTHPLFVLLLARFGRTSGVICLCEVVIFIFEAFALSIYYGQARIRRAVFAAFLMNATSLATGLLLDLGWKGCG